jgi:hypothetical protein
MAATLIGTVGTWGIASSEAATGIIIESIDDTSKKQSNYVRDKTGERIGRSDYDESMEIQLKGKMTSSTPFSQKISGNLTMVNTITSGHLQTASAGRTLIDEVQRTRASEDWIGVSVTAEMLPFFT